MKQMIATADEIAEVLAEIDDEDAAEDAADELKDLIQEIGTLDDELSKMREDSDDDGWEGLDEDLLDEFVKGVNRIRKEVAGLMATDYGQKELAEVLRELGRLSSWRAKKAMLQMIAKADEIAELLEEIDDEDAAEGAADELKDLVEEVEELDDELKGMRKEMDGDEWGNLEEEFKAEFLKRKNRIRKEAEGLKATDYGRKELGDLLRKID